LYSGCIILNQGTGTEKQTTIRRVWRYQRGNKNQRRTNSTMAKRTRGSVGWTLCRSPFVLFWGNVVQILP